MSDARKPDGGPTSVEGILEELYAFGDLEFGWDGEVAEAASWPSIRDATRLVRAAGPLALAIQPTLHADGTVILETEAGSLGFPGDSTVTYAFEDVDPGRVDFDGANLPATLATLLGRTVTAA